MRRLLIRLLNFFLIALLAFAIWVGWYASHHGFGQKWRKKVAEEFARRGVWLSMRRLTLDPLRGLVAQDVKIFQDSRRQKLIASMDQVNLDISYTRLLQKTSFVNAMELRDAEIWLPVEPDQPNSRSIRVENLQARLYFPPGRVEVHRLEGDFKGIHFNFSGTLLHPDQYHASKGEASSTTGKSTDLKRIYEELSLVSLSANPASLTVRFSGDLARMETIRVEELQFAAADVLWRKIIAHHLLLTGSYSAGRLSVEQLSWDDPNGKTRVSGWRDDNGDFSTQIQTMSDWLGAAGEVFPNQSWAGITTWGSVDLRAEISFSQNRVPALQVLGSVESGPWTFHSISFDSFKSNFSSDGTRWMLRNLKISQKNGDISANLLAGPDGFEASVTSNLDPLLLLPAIADPLPAVLQELHFQSAPQAELSISGPGLDPARWQTIGKLTLGETTFRGYSLNSARCNLEVKGRAAQFKNIQVVRDEGVGTGDFSWNADTHTVTLENIHSSLDPVAVCMWVSPKIGQAVVPYRFRRSPEVRASGVVIVNSPTGTALNLQVEADGGMDYVFLKQTLPFDRVQSNLLFKDRRLEISDFLGTLFDGQVEGTADISLLPEKRDYQATISVNDIDFPKISGLYFGYTGSRGKLTGNAQIAGLGLDAQKLSGKGKVIVKDGDVFTIPVFGPLSKTLDQFVPGLGYNQARRAGASFSLADGELTTSDFEIAGNGVSMFGDGEIGFLDSQMDFNMRVNATGITGVVLDPVSKFLEFHSNGPLHKPVWKPRNLPGN